MPDSATSWGSLHRQGEQVRVRLEREIEHDIHRVWEMLTDSFCLAKWLAPGEIEQRPGGTVKIDFGQSGTAIDSTVTAIRRPEVLEYSWSAGDAPAKPVSWKLTHTDYGTKLELDLEVPDDDLVAISCAGWDAHLEMLMAALEDIPIHFPKDRFKQARTAFGEMASGAAV